MVNTAAETAMTGPVADPTGVMAALSVDEVSHRFGAKMALDAVSLRVAAGCFTTLLGINGAGKTTLFNFITRLFGARADYVFGCMAANGQTRDNL